MLRSPSVTIPGQAPGTQKSTGGVHQEAAQQISLVTIATATGAGTWPTVNEGMGRRKECAVEGKRPSKAAPDLSCFSYTLQVCLVIFAALLVLLLNVAVVRGEWLLCESAL